MPPKAKKDDKAKSTDKKGAKSTDKKGGKSEDKKPEKDKKGNDKGEDAEKSSTLLCS